MYVAKRHGKTQVGMFSSLANVSKYFWDIGVMHNIKGEDVEVSLYRLEDEFNAEGIARIYIDCGEKGQMLFTIEEQ